MKSATVALLFIYVLYNCFLEQKMVNKVSCELGESRLEYNHKMMESGLKSRIYGFTEEDVFAIQTQNIYSGFFSYFKLCNSLQVKFLSLLFPMQVLGVSIITQETSIQLYALSVVYDFHSFRPSRQPLK